MEEGIVPNEMKLAIAVPIYKEGDIHKEKNYWPISVLPIFSKILEKVNTKTIVFQIFLKNLENPQSQLWLNQLKKQYSYMIICGKVNKQLVLEGFHVRKINRLWRPARVNSRPSPFYYNDLSRYIIAYAWSCDANGALLPKGDSMEQIYFSR